MLDQPSFEKFASRVLRRGVQGVRRITDVIRKKQTGISESPENILLIKRRGLGALICATPVMAALRGKFPGARICLCVSKSNEPLYRDTGLFDATLGWDCQRLRELPRAVRRFRAEAAEMDFELTINLDGLSELSTLLSMSAGGATIGFVAPDEKRRGYTAPVKIVPDAHATHNYLNLLTPLGLENQDHRPVPPRVRVSEQEQARELLRTWGVDEHTHLIGINMNAEDFASCRAWPGEKFVILAQEIEEMGEYRTVFFGSQNESRYVTRHIKHMENQPINLTGRTSIRQLAALLKEMHLLIANDSGPLHLAAILGTPTVGLFGPESPERFGPPDNVQNAVIWQKPKAGPFVSFLEGAVDRNSPDFECMRELSLEEVRSTVMDMLDHLADPDEPPWM